MFTKKKNRFIVKQNNNNLIAPLLDHIFFTNESPILKVFNNYEHIT